MLQWWARIVEGTSAEGTPVEGLAEQGAAVAGAVVVGAAVIRLKKTGTVVGIAVREVVEWEGM